MCASRAGVAQAQHAVAVREDIQHVVVVPLQAEEAHCGLGTPGGAGRGRRHQVFFDCQVKLSRGGCSTYA
eukprot:6400976-Prymnesium_polylepis.1